MIMTDQLKLTLASGVVHGLKWINPKSGRVIIPTGFHINEKGEIILDEKWALWNLSIWPFVPMMHPTSKLTEAILPDGKIPIVELFKKANPFYKISESCIAIHSTDFGSFAYDKNDDYDKNIVLYYTDWHNWPTWITDQLDAWHINYRGVEAVEIVND